MYRGAWPSERVFVETKLGTKAYVLVPDERHGTVDVIDVVYGALLEGVKPENVKWAEVREWSKAPSAGAST
ncbi:hypothetical protein ACFYVL_33330 [Streptomyces sp. NPDC004111]|uniref:hypothetical protein n=1 Tax=Streptomyces sp. NPDC004111 TaxID=3364690 RepID=UPI003681FB74